MSSIQLKYEYGIEMDEARRALQSALYAVDVAEGVQEPSIAAISMNMIILC